jgi:hypothetical protein
LGQAQTVYLADAASAARAGDFASSKPHKPVFKENLLSSRANSAIFGKKETVVIGVTAPA